eukprot:17885_1
MQYSLEGVQINSTDNADTYTTGSIIPLLCWTFIMLVVTSTQNIKSYKKYETLMEDISYILMIKACINTNNFEFGKGIINKNIDCMNNKYSINLMNELIDFYGHRGDIKAYVSVFNEIINKDKEIISYGSMMNTYCMNDLNEEA